MSQADVPIDPDTTRIRTAAGHCFRHRSDEVLVRPEIAMLANPASYSVDRVILRVRFPCQHAAYPVQRVNFLDQRRSARGHEDAFPPHWSNAGYVIGKETVAWVRGSGRDGPVRE